MSKDSEFIVVIGASAGGLNALVEMVQNLEQGLNVAYCVVLHLSRKGIGDFIVHRLKQVTTMPCSIAKNDEEIQISNIYIAPPNHHLLVKDNKFMLGSGPAENRFRPSIDVLFRSAAAAYGSNTIGIILSGLLNDGTSGMWAIKRSGGTCIVQDPNQSEYPDMPLSVINNMEVDHVASLEEIGGLVAQTVKHQQGDKKTAPKDVIAESRIAERTNTSLDAVRQLDVHQSVLACPDCGGGLWEVKNDIIKRYRCHVGHAYTERDLIIKQDEMASSTLWVALRMMEERKHLLKKLEAEYSNKGYKSLSASSAEQQSEIIRHIDKLKEILFEMQNHDTAQE